MLGEVVERRRAVDESVVLDGQLGRVLAGDVAEIQIPGARAHVDERVVGEGVVGPVEVEDPAPRERRILAREAPVVGIVLAAGAGEGAGRRVEADAAAVEVEHDLGRVGPALPEGELAAIGTLAVASGHDPFPPGVVGGDRGGSGVVVVIVATTVAVEGERSTTARHHHDGHRRGGEAPAAHDPPPARGSALRIDLVVVIVPVGWGSPVRRAQGGGVVLLAMPVLVGPTRLIGCLIHEGDTERATLRRT